MLIAVVDQKIIEELWDLVEASGRPLTLTLLHVITGPDFNCDFEIDNYTRWRLLEGLDDIGLTLRQVEHIDAYEIQRPALSQEPYPPRWTPPPDLCRSLLNDTQMCRRDDCLTAAVSLA